MVNATEHEVHFGLCMLDDSTDLEGGLNRSVKI